MVSNNRITILWGEIMFTNTSAILYKFNGLGYDRYDISECFWSNEKQAQISNNGLVGQNVTNIYIPKSAITKNNIPKNPTKDMFVRGKCFFVFNNSDAKTVSESFKQFKREYSFVTVMSIDNKVFGSDNMQHIFISAK